MNVKVNPRMTHPSEIPSRVKAPPCLEQEEGGWWTVLLTKGNGGDGFRLDAGEGVSRCPQTRGAKGFGTELSLGTQLHSVP